MKIVSMVHAFGSIWIAFEDGTLGRYAPGIDGMCLDQVEGFPVKGREDLGLAITDKNGSLFYHRGPATLNMELSDLDREIPEYAPHRLVRIFAVEVER